MGRSWSKQRCDVWKRRIRRIAKAGPGTMLKWVGEAAGWDEDLAWSMRPAPREWPAVRLGDKVVKVVFAGDTMTLMGPVEVRPETGHSCQESGTRASAAVLLSDGRVGVFDDIGGCMVLWDPNASTRKKRKK